MGNNKKRLYKALNVGLFIFVEDDLEFDERKTHVLFDFARMNSDDQVALLEALPESDNKQALYLFASTLEEWIGDVDWANMPSDDLEHVIKDKPEVFSLYNAVSDVLWQGESQELFLRYGVGIIVPQLMEDLFTHVIRSEARYMPVRIYKNYIEETHTQILEDLKKEAADDKAAALILDNVVGTERLAKQMIDDLKAMDPNTTKRIYATILSTATSLSGESIMSSDLHVGYAQKANGIADVHRNLVYAAINILIQKYKRYYKSVVEKNCDLLSENPQLVDYLFSMAQEEGAPGYDVFQEWLTFMINHEMENSKEFEELIKLSVCVDEYESERNKNPAIPIQLIDAASTENYFNTINKFCTITSPGDIFYYDNKYYVLIGQDCEYMMGDSRKRSVPVCELLCAELIPQAKCEKLADDSKYVYINNFKDSSGHMNVLKVDYSKRKFISNEVLNLCCFNKNGFCKIDYAADLQEDISQIIQPYMVEYYSDLKGYFSAVSQVKKENPHFFELQTKLHTVCPLIPIDKYQQEGSVLDYEIKRVSHLKSVACLYLHKMYLEYRGRIPYTTVNLTGYSAISMSLCHADKTYPLTVFVKLSNRRTINRKSDCRDLVWNLQKEELNKALSEFGHQISISDFGKEYVELPGKDSFILELEEKKLKFTKRKNDGEFFIDLVIETIEND